MGNRTFEQYFRCPPDSVAIEAAGDLSAAQGYFRLGDTICYGRCAGLEPSSAISDSLPDVSRAAVSEPGRLNLPFDLSEVVVNLQQERYCQPSPRFLERVTATNTARSIYYWLRPILPVSARKHLQKARLSGWENIAFPRWPVDCTVETLMERAMTLALKSGRPQRIPFIWFWPDGAHSCALMTHDVEGAAGRDFCSELMDLDDSIGIKAAFQIVPEMGDRGWRALADGIRRRGFEVNVHDLNHDGSLFRGKEQFLKGAEQINRYARDFQCRGFRSGSMYREQRWYGAFEFSYDMSVPNVAHLEPQRGGCCTVMPYFVGNILELPLTTTQDYSLFHIIGDYSIALWKRQIELILARNGLVSFIAHPDYIRERRARAVYSDLLAYLAELRATRGVWMAMPADIDRWWRNRDAMSLRPDGRSWRIEGPDSDRARLAWATLDDDGRLVYSLNGRREASR